MDSSFIVISDSDENDNLPSLNVTLNSDENFSEEEVIAQRSRVGNPNITTASSCSSVDEELKSSTTVIMDVINLTSDDDEDEDFDMQRAIANSLQGFAPAMGYQGRCKGKTKQYWADRDQDSSNIWSQKQAEYVALRTPPHASPTSSVSQSPIKISSEDSGAEDSDTLPDLDDIFSDLDTTGVTSDTLQHSHTSVLKKLSRMGSPRRIPNRERHFLDTFQPAIKYRKMKEDSGSSKSKDIVRSDKTRAKSGSEQSKRRKDRISQEMQAGSIPVDQEKYKIFKFPPDTTSKPPAEKKVSGSESEGRYLRNKFSGVRFLQDLSVFPPVMDRLCSDFVKLQTACLDDLLDDLCDHTHFSNCMDLLEDFCYKRKPHPMLIDKIIHNGFLHATGEDMLVRTYHFVLKLWQQFPELIKVDLQLVLVSGDVLQKHLQNSVPSSSNSRSLSWSSGGDTVTGKPSVQQSRLYFQLFVKGLQLSLSRCTLADQKSVNKSLAFMCLSSEGSKTLVKQLTHWLEFCLVVRHQEHVAMAKMWMSELQTLLGVCVLVSRDRQEAAKKLAPELKRTYKYLTDLNAKKQLLQSFSCPLLSFYVLRLVMEDQCESTIVSSQFPSTIQEIVHNYYFALPPQDHLTPPPSPSEDGYEMRHGQSWMYSVQSCEELAMLIYFISKSFITCKQRRLNSDLRQQILKGPNIHTLSAEQKRHFQCNIQEFGAHLQALCPEFNAATSMYLSLLECLCLTL